MTYSLKSGLDILENKQLQKISGLKIGVLANPSAVNSNYSHVVDILSKDKGCQLIKLFAPEHGFYAAAQDMIPVDDTSSQQLQIVSLYGNTVDSLKPSEDDFDDIECLIVDLPDVGSRYYTYAQTLAFAMEVASQKSVKVLVLDRPNPIGGNIVEGADLHKECQSFCGLVPVPNRHGLTLGELGSLYKVGYSTPNCKRTSINCDLEIIRVENWKRSSFLDETNIPWVIPSPNMPTLDTAIVYPGTCLFEATKISEGRGTTKPFEVVGAPYIDGSKWATAAFQEGIEITGAVLRPLQFLPQFHKHKGEICGGVQIHVTDRNEFRPFRLALCLISSLKKLYPKDFAWRTDPYEFISDIQAIDLLYGSSSFRELVENGGNLNELTPEIEKFEEDYKKDRKDFLLY